MKIIFIIPLIIGAFTTIQSDGKVQESRLNKIVFEDFNKSNLTEGNFEITNSSIMIKLNYEMKNNVLLNEDESFENYHARLLQVGREFHEQKNKDIVESSLLGKIPNLYVSAYAPYVSFKSDETTDLNMLLDLTSDNNIEKIIVTDSQSTKPELELAKEFVGVRSTITSGELTGKGITVGILEPNILDKSHENFGDTDVLVRDEWLYNETISDHTTIMGSIIAGKNGIAPKAKLLSVELNGDALSEIDWLLDNGVNIINCSYGDASPTGVYSSKSAYMDYISNIYRITFVASSGNTGTTDKYVANPGLGYNVITVGASSSTTAHRRTFSSYVVKDGPSKPNILAPGHSINVKPFGAQEGTSLSAAITTGCIALMMEKVTAFQTNPALLRAILMANAKVPSDAYRQTYGLHDQIGAGCIDFKETINNIGGLTQFHNTQNKSNLGGKGELVQSGQSIRAALSWMAYSNGNADSIAFTDYDIVIKNSSDDILLSSSGNEENLEFLDYTVTKTDVYMIEVLQNGNIVQNDFIGLAYRIF